MTLRITDVTIDPELRDLLPPLSPDERSLLVESIQREGFRDSIIVWLGHGTLLDGHNRMSIWMQELEADEDKAPEIVERPFVSIEAAKEWMLRNQLARRNLCDAKRVEIAMLLSPMIELKAKANIVEGAKMGGSKPLTNLSKAIEPVNVRKELAAIAGVSEGTFAKVTAVMERGTEETKAAMLAPKADPSHISISKAYETVRPSKPAPETPVTAICQDEEEGEDSSDMLSTKTDDSVQLIMLKQCWGEASKKDRRNFWKCLPTGEKPAKPVTTEPADDDKIDLM
jgi:hypothetical protein